GRGLGRGASGSREHRALDSLSTLPLSPSLSPVYRGEGVAPCAALRTSPHYTALARMESPQASTSPLDTPPRAFSQGVGTVFQVAGVLVFLYASFSCCGSGLLSREWATQFT